MNYHQYYPIDVVNGPGTRCTLFVAGCVHQCPGCYNKSTAAQLRPAVYPGAGRPHHRRSERYARAAPGLSLSGGDPLHPANVPSILTLVKRVRAECPGKDIWLWTGYRLAELDAQQMQVVDRINVLIDGKFVQDLKDPALIWRGSSNRGA